MKLIIKEHKIYHELRNNNQHTEQTTTDTELRDQRNLSSGTTRFIRRQSYTGGPIIDNHDNS